MIAPTLIFWVFALVDMVIAVSCATTAVLRVRRGDVEGHVRMMVTAQLAIGVFLAAYLAKVVLVGHEDLTRWGAQALLHLRVHEVAVSGMLGGGVIAASVGWRVRRAVREQGSAGRAIRGLHRGAGWLTLACAWMGVVTAAFVFSHLALGED